MKIFFKYLLFFFLLLRVLGHASAQENDLSRDELRAARKEVRQVKRYQRALENTLEEKELFFSFALMEDLDKRNFDNLGWWQYQYNQYQTIISDTLLATPFNSLKIVFAKKSVTMMRVLLSNTYELEANRPSAFRDIPAVVFLLMLRTIVNPTDYIAYLSVISYSSKVEDYGTALFYLEEAFKNGFNNLDLLLSLPATGLLRIMPEYQALLEVYLKNGFYGIREEDFK